MRLADLWSGTSSRKRLPVRVEEAIAAEQHASEILVG